MKLSTLKKLARIATGNSKNIYNYLELDLEVNTITATNGYILKCIKLDTLINNTTYKKICIEGKQFERLNGNSRSSLVVVENGTLIFFLNNSNEIVKIPFVSEIEYPDLKKVMPYKPDYTTAFLVDSKLLKQLLDASSNGVVEFLTSNSYRAIIAKFTLEDEQNISLIMPVK